MTENVRRTRASKLLADSEFVACKEMVRILENRM
jgi:hypothetical protein